MPFVSIDSPSIQLGLLSAIARGAGAAVAAFHLSLDFAQQIGTHRYSVLAKHRGRLYGDWLFAREATLGALPAADAFLRDFECEIAADLHGLGACPRDQLASLRVQDVPRYLDRLLATIDWSSFDVVGFTSTFQQNMASFSLARRIKHRFPRILTLFGGANFDGEMGAELVRSFDCIDYAISGAADHSLVDFLSAVAANKEPSEVAGVLSRASSAVAKTPASMTSRDLDALPVPDYESYFERAEALGLLSRSARRHVALPFESSRGCWWGQKQHCTFCGLNGESMAYRAKSADRVVAELAELASRHGTFRFEAVDNILPMSYLRDLLPRLVATGTTYEFFYETKANLRRDQLRLMAAAGVRVIQPGIESLSSHVLKLMRKGVSSAQNVNLLRWASYYGIRVVWNLLWGFPGETSDDIELQSNLVDHLLHLPPPLSASRIWMERFSPIFTDRDSFPTRRLEPEASYRHVYGDGVERSKVAYFFEYEFDADLPEPSYDQAYRKFSAWREAWQRSTPPTMLYRASPGLVQIEDGRHCGRTSVFTLRGSLAALYLACSEAPVSLEQLVSSDAGLGRMPTGLEQRLEEMCAQGLMMRDGNVFLSLAVPVGPRAVSVCET